jgi:hypothetical protein
MDPIALTRQIYYRKFHVNFMLRIRYIFHTKETCTANYTYESSNTHRSPKDTALKIWMIFDFLPVSTRHVNILNMMLSVVYIGLHPLRYL